MAKSSKFSDPDVLARISSIGLRARQVVEGTLSGLHRSPYRGANVEFAEYREYAPGDDLRRLDWRVFGRTDRYFIKQFEEDSNLRCALVLDTSASMAYGSQALNKYEYAATIAAAIAMLLIRQQDAVGLVLCDRDTREKLDPVATPSQMTRILELLERTVPRGETLLGATIAQLSEQLPRHSFVIVLSDLFTDEQTLADGLARLRFRGNETLLFHVLDRDEIELPFRDPVIFQDMEGTEEIYAEPWAFRQAYQQAVEEFRERMRRLCHEQRADYVPLRTDHPLSEALSQYLHLRTRT